MTPCARCNGLGFVTLFNESDLGRVEVCPVCAGSKHKPEPIPRALLGLCKFCSKEIHFPASDIPCIVGRTTHVIAPKFNSLGETGETNG